MVIGLLKWAVSTKLLRSYFIAVGQWVTVSDPWSTRPISISCVKHCALFLTLSKWNILLCVCEAVRRSWALVQLARHSSTSSLRRVSHSEDGVNRDSSTWTESTHSPCHRQDFRPICQIKSGLWAPVGGGRFWIIWPKRINESYVSVTVYHRC